MRGIFNSHSVTTLKKKISKTNIKGYSKMKKAEIVNLMVKNQSRFAHIKMNEKKSAPKKTEPRKKIVMTSFPKPKGKQRVPNEEPAPAKLQEAEGSRPKPKKKKKLVIKEKVKKEILELPQLKAITGLTKAEANKLDPAELFGLLPSEISKKILNPKETGVKVGNLEELEKEANKIRETTRPTKKGTQFKLELELLEGKNKKELLKITKDLGEQFIKNYGYPSGIRILKGGSLKTATRYVAQQLAKENSGYNKIYHKILVLKGIRPDLK